MIDWPRGQSGEFRLEHWVTDTSNQGTCYMAYFDIADGPEDPWPGAEIVHVTRAGTGRVFAYDSLRAAVADLRYGDTISIDGDVQLEAVDIPKGVSVTVGDKGVYRPPVAADAQTGYYRPVISTDKSSGNVTGFHYELDEEMVRPSVGGEDGAAFGPVYDASGKIVGFRMEIGNVKEGLT